MSDLKTNLQEILQEKQDKIIPDNIKKDVQIFDVIGTYEGSGSSGGGDVKLFETVEEMQADENAQEGDLAVVYKKEVQNMTVDTQTQYITFPETVTLPNAITSDYYCVLRSADENTNYFDGQISLSSTRFYFIGVSSVGNILAQYTSSDGINYTRTALQNDTGSLTNPVDLGVIVQINMSEEWNDNIGYFMQIEQGLFNGLYESKGQDDYNNIGFVTDITFNNKATGLLYNDSDVTVHYKYLQVSQLLQFCTDNNIISQGKSYTFLYSGGSNKWYIYFSTRGHITIVKQGDNTYLIIGSNNGEGTYTKHEINLEDSTVNTTEHNINEGAEFDYPFSGDTWYIMQDFTLNEDAALYQYILDINNPFSREDEMDWSSDYTDWSAGYSIYRVVRDIGKKYVYQLALTQFTLQNNNQLLSGVIAYGKNGVITGELETPISSEEYNTALDTSKQILGEEETVNE